MLRERFLANTKEPYVFVYGLISSVALTNYLKQDDQVTDTHELQIEQRNPEFLLVV